MSVRNLILNADPGERRIQTNGRLYFWAAFLAAVYPVFDACAKYDYWPSAAKIFTGALGGTLAGVVALRAYRDGSYQRHQDGKTKPEVKP